MACAGAGANPLVEWRVFLPLNQSVQGALSSIVLGDIFQGLPVEAEDGVEDRVDSYLLVGASEGVGLKHRGAKKKATKLEVKVRTHAWTASECLGVPGGVEAWTKHKLGKGGKADGGGGGEGAGPCVEVRRVGSSGSVGGEEGIWLDRPLFTHGV